MKAFVVTSCPENNIHAVCRTHEGAIAFLKAVAHYCYAPLQDEGDNIFLVGGDFFTIHEEELQD
jgi:hypothetical protein